MRLISCAITERQIDERSKTETRRLGWKNVKVGQLLCFVDKCMGLKPGQKPRRICIVRVTSTWREPLKNILKHDVIAEGFPEMTPREFVQMFCGHMGCKPVDDVTVIRFQFIPGGRF